MKNDQKLYQVDIVFCIDCTETMSNILNIVKTNAINFYRDLKNTMENLEIPKRVDKLRVRVVAFRDYLAYDQEMKRTKKANYPMLETGFFTLPEEAEKFEISVKSLYPIGGGDDEEDALEALAYAIRSDWDFDDSKNHRHLIILWTDAPPHEIGFGRKSTVYPQGMAKDYTELTSWWGTRQNPGCMKLQDAKRLILYAPNCSAWKDLANTWNQTLLYPSKAGEGLKDTDYQSILSVIAGSI